MKKLFILLLTILLGVGSVNAKELWTGSCAIGDWSGSTVMVDKEQLSDAAVGNVIKVTFAAYAEKAGNGDDVTYWQYSLGQKDNGWMGLTGFADGNLNKGQKSASYVLTSDNVDELQAYGLVVSGRYITVTKVELLNTTEENVWTGSTETGDWASNVALTYNDKGILANAQMNDYVRMTYTVTASGAQAAIQNAGWSSLIGKDDNSYVAEGDNTGKTLIFAIDDAATLEGIQMNGLLLRGKNITITGCDLVKSDNRYDAVPLTIGSDGICTYGSSKSLDFSGLAGIAVPYYVSSIAEGTVNLTSVSVTRGWAGYIVQGTPGTYDIPVAGAEPDWTDAFQYLRYAGDYNGNWVYRSHYSGYSAGGGDEEKIKTYYRYIFAKDGSDNIAFYKLAEDYENGGNPYHILNAHKAYLETPKDITPTAGARGINLVFEDETTGISSAELVQPRDEAIYTLSGMRVNKPARGLYITGGRKVFVK